MLGAKEKMLVKQAVGRRVKAPVLVRTVGTMVVLGGINRNLGTKGKTLVEVMDPLGAKLWSPKKKAVVQVQVKWTGKVQQLGQKIRLEAGPSKV